MTVSFPSLGIDLSINRVAFYFSGIPIYWYGIIISIALISGVFVASIAAKKLGDNSEIPLDLAIYCGPVAVVFARVYYVVFNLRYYLANPGDILNLRGGGIAIYGAVIGGVLAAFIYSKIKKYKVLSVFDIGSVGLICGQMIGRWGNFFNQEAFGTNTNLPWGMISENTVSYLEELQKTGVMVDPNLPVHPTFLYESLWSLAVLITLFVIIRRRSYKGQVFFAYTALYGVGRFFIEGLRTDSLMLGGVRVSQGLALLCVVVFGFLYFCFLKKSKSEADTD
jgi:phosphatidylglycerol:prolipoprotein diacylglycerol transferase